MKLIAFNRKNKKYEMTNKKRIVQKIFRVLCLMTLLLNHSISFAQVYGQNGMVVSSNVLASQIGVDILKKGGNAIDATVATAFALAVTHPSAGNIGGGGFLVFIIEVQDVEALSPIIRQSFPFF